jgi:rhodanese-related sulfurtransferase
LLKDGYPNAAALGGGVEAWKNAGYPMKLWFTGTAL